MSPVPKEVRIRDHPKLNPLNHFWSLFVTWLQTTFVHIMHRFPLVIFTFVSSAGPWQSLLLVSGFMRLGMLFEVSQEKITKVQKPKKRVCLSRK